ncbi:hypothetical protein [Streptomyces pseudovenezuelae]|uniref:Arginine/lysine/ornithine decarboxylase n=1 Tax=Streptomyces pseudovenezuelae TaxID=67350 RepID=A0ABT6LTJ9_9ACTN|nr:hypothetical protein [Streptomyces pseudovenezuelae]MDH6219636.1 arginine/lysine/ornithine decarboxylase [Streptomyces pseudovenezuelae]
MLARFVTRYLLGFLMLVPGQVISADVLAFIEGAVSALGAGDEEQWG